MLKSDCFKSCLGFPACVWKATVKSLWVSTTVGGDVDERRSWMSPFLTELLVDVPTIVKYSVVSAPWIGSDLTKTESILNSWLSHLTACVFSFLSSPSASLHFSWAEAPMDPLAPLPLLSSVSWCSPRTLWTLCVGRRGEGEQLMGRSPAAEAGSSGDADGTLSRR